MENKNLTQKPVGKKTAKAKKEKVLKIKNQLLLRRGGFSLLITVLFLAAVIVFNVLIGALSDRFNLEYDLSAEKQSTVTKENVEYIKSIDTPITITVCAGEENYVTYMANYAPQIYYLMEDYSDYYQQTVRFINKYPEYNKKITVNFVDMYNDSEFSEIYYKYSNESISYGDIIVSAVLNNNGTETERHKVVGFEDIYNMVEDSSSSYYAQLYGSSYYTISGNNVESAISGAIDYVLGVDKNAVMLTGHSADTTESYYDAYEELLVSANFNVERLDSLAVNELPENCDVVVIIQPNIDFQASELDALNTFLYNNGDLQKSLIYIGGSTVQSMPNLNEFLSDWGIVVGEGKLFETSGDYCLSGDPTAIYMSSSYGGLVLTDNIPITVGTPVDTDVEAKMMINSPETTVNAPVGAGADWNEYTSADLGTYALMAYANKTGYTDAGEEVSSAVFAFSSVDFVSPKMNATINDQFVQLANDAFIESGTSEISFTPKTIVSDSFTPTESGSRAIQIIFVALLPISMIVVAIVIYIRRKNAK